jgi:uncharacterized protein YndB with AHSA1/START domain
MNHFQLETRVEAPVGHVWAFLCDPSHLEDWTRAKTSDVSGPLDQVGTTFVQTSRTLGFEMNGTLTILEVEPMRLLHLRSDMDPDMVFRFAPEGDATHLTFVRIGHLDEQGAAEALGLAVGLEAERAGDRVPRSDLGRGPGEGERLDVVLGVVRENPLDPHPVAREERRRIE